MAEKENKKKIFNTKTDKAILGFGILFILVLIGQYSEGKIYPSGSLESAFNSFLFLGFISWLVYKLFNRWRGSIAVEKILPIIIIILTIIALIVFLIVKLKS